MIKIKQNHRMVKVEHNFKEGFLKRSPFFKITRIENRILNSSKNLPVFRKLVGSKNA